MSYTTIYFLVQADDLDEAEGKITAYLEKETFFDYSNVMTESSGPLEEKRGELMEYIGNWDRIKSAEKFLWKAGNSKETGALESYGYYLIKAGELYAQYLNIDTYVYNIESEDYSIPAEDKGWWLIAVYFHY